MKKALIIYGGWEGHEPKETAYIAKEILEKENFSVEMSEDLNALTKENAKENNLIVINFTMSEITQEQCSALLELVKTGVGVAGWHGGFGDAFRNDTMFQYMVGGQFVNHPDNTCDYSVNIVPNDELLEGIADFDMHSEQYYCHVDPAVTVHATTVYKNSVDYWVNNTVMPVVWTKKFGKGKVFYSSLGHIASDFSDSVKEILRRGFLWAAK
ncbi:MAG: ThuA domain-containing protein [Armatimonadetes bacterium]|nr:ThuA domain-containing protein [Candidatus Hippobium faecium]